MTKPTVCLALIVKNEAHILRRCLDSALPYVDSLVVCDTGSTDGTQNVVKEYLEGIGGELIEEEWVDFGHNRSSLLEHARKQGTDYLLLLDADHVLDAPEGSLDVLEHDSYLIEIHDSVRYWMPYLIKASAPFRYIGATHEFLNCDAPFTQEKHPTLSILHHGDGGTRPEKFNRDLSLLEREVEKNPNDPRTLFYLAETYRNTGDHQAARHIYQRRVDVGGWDEETYVALLHIAEMSDSLEDYLKAWEFRPCRPEALHHALERINHLGLHRLGKAIVWSDEVYNLLNTSCDDVLFVESWRQEYGIPFEIGIALWWSGEKSEAKKTFENLLANEDLPEHYRLQTIQNLKFCED